MWTTAQDINLSEALLRQWWGGSSLRVSPLCDQRWDWTTRAAFWNRKLQLEREKQSRQINNDTDWPWDWHGKSSKGNHHMLSCSLIRHPFYRYGCLEQDYCSPDSVSNSNKRLSCGCWPTRNATLKVCRQTDRQAGRNDSPHIMCQPLKHTVRFSISRGYKLLEALPSLERKHLSSSLQGWWPCCVDLFVQMNGLYWLIWVEKKILLESCFSESSKRILFWLRFWTLARWSRMRLLIIPMWCVTV